MERVIIIRAKSTCKLKKLRCMNTLTVVGMKDNGRATNDMVRVTSYGLQEALTTASLKMTVEMAKEKCSTLMEPSTMVPGGTTPVTGKEFLNGPRALDGLKEISETIRCMETVL